MEERLEGIRKMKLLAMYPCLISVTMRRNACQPCILIRLPIMHYVQFVLAVAHFPQILDAVILFIAIDMVDFHHGETAIMPDPDGSVHP